MLTTRFNKADINNYIQSIETNLGLIQQNISLKDHFKKYGRRIVDDMKWYGDIAGYINNNDLKEYLLNKDFVSCSQVTFKFLGISLAGYNVIVSFILFNLSVIGYKN